MADGQTTVRFRDCECPGSPHPDGDVVYLRPFLGFLAGAEAMRLLITGMGDETRLNELVGPHYLREGVIGWNLTDEEGPVDLDTERLLALPWDETYLIAEAADTLYSERVLRPLLPRRNGSSPGSPTASTSRTRRSSKRVQKLAPRSSRGTSAAGTRTAP